jgi:hypothetical protein
MPGNVDLAKLKSSSTLTIKTRSSAGALFAANIHRVNRFAAVRRADQLINRRRLTLLMETIFGIDRRQPAGSARRSFSQMVSIHIAPACWGAGLFAGAQKVLLRRLLTTFNEPRFAGGRGH